MLEYQETMNQLYQISLSEGVNWSYVVRNFAVSSIPAFLIQYYEEKIPQVGPLIFITGMTLAFAGCFLSLPLVPQISAYLKDNQNFYNLMGVLGGGLSGALLAKAIYDIRK